MGLSQELGGRSRTGRNQYQSQEDIFDEQLDLLNNQAQRWGRIDKEQVEVLLRQASKLGKQHPAIQF